LASQQSGRCRLQHTSWKVIKQETNKGNLVNLSSLVASRKIWHQPRFIRSKAFTMFRTLKSPKYSTKKKAFKTFQKHCSMVRMQVNQASWIRSFRYKNQCTTRIIKVRCQGITALKGVRRRYLRDWMIGLLYLRLN
jgi:hypothetical protein